MRNPIVYLLGLLIFLASCSQSEQHTGFRIKGKIKNNKTASISVSELTAKGLIMLDTGVVMTDGSFELTGQVTEKTFCALNLPGGSVILVVDTASEIYLSLDADNPDVYGVNGSPESESLRSLIQLNNKYIRQVKQLEKRYGAYTEDLPPVEVQKKIRTDYDSIMSGRKHELENFVTQSTPSLVGYFATNYLMPESNFEFLESVDKRLFPTLSASKYAQEHHARVEKLRRTAIGQSAPDIILEDPFGKTTALSAFRGKYVLLDFWASWCRPCREESPNLLKLYNRYKSYGFDVFSVSLDDNKDAWIKAINDDHLLWTHVSDLKKWNSMVVELYNIEGIPFTLLLNKDGKIIAKNLRGDDLARKLEEAIREGR